MPHRIKELLTALPVETSAARRLFMKETGISRDKFYRFWANPESRISTEDALRIAHFFSIEVKELYCKTENVLQIVEKIMNESPAIKNLRTHELEARPEPSRSEMAQRTARGNAKSRA